jgi:hypothetical protein
MQVPSVSLSIEDQVLQPDFSPRQHPPKNLNPTKLHLNSSSRRQVISSRNATRDHSNRDQTRKGRKPQQILNRLVYKVSPKAALCSLGEKRHQRMDLWVRKLGQPEIMLDRLRIV